MSFKPENIIIETEEGSEFYKIRYKEGKRSTKIMFQIDHAQIPFGLDEEYGQYYITIGIRDKEYIEYIKTIEEGLREVLCERLLDDAVIFEEIGIRTQIRPSKNNYLIKTKIPQYKERFIVTCKDNSGFYKSILDIEKGSWGTFVLYIDYAWLKDEQIHYKWKVHRLELE